MNEFRVECLFKNRRSLYILRDGWFWWIYMCVHGFVCMNDYSRNPLCMGLLSNIGN